MGVFTSAKVIKLTYHPNFRDNFYGVLFGFWGSRRAALKSGLMSLIFGGISGLALGAKLPVRVTVIIGLTAAALWGVLFTLGFGAWAAAYITKRQRAKGDAQIVLSDDHVERVSGATSLKQQWSGISRIAETRRAFFMFDETRPVFSIEKSAVESPADLMALRQFLRAKKPGTYLE